MGDSSTMTRDRSSISVPTPSPTRWARLASLLPHRRGGLQQKAERVLAHLISYIGNVDGPQAGRSHITKVMSAGLQHASLRDEIYLQILEQTMSSNPMYQMRAWQAMLLCSGTFPPSLQLRPYLESHFLLHRREGNLWMAIEQQEDPTAKIGWRNRLAGFWTPREFSSAAHLCLARMDRVTKFGPRQHTPSTAEIVVMEKLEGVEVSIRLPDRTSREILVDTTSIAEDVVDELAATLGLPDSSQYALFRLGDRGIEEALPSGMYTMDSQEVGQGEEVEVQRTGGFKSLVYSVLVKAASKVHPALEKTYGRFILSPANGGDPLMGASEVCGSSVQMDLIFKRKWFLGRHGSCCESDMGVAEEFEFEYWQATHDVLNSVYPLVEKDVATLAALLLMAELGSKLDLESIESIPLDSYIPRSQLIRRSPKRWRQIVIAASEDLPLDPDLLVRRKHYLAELKRMTPLYGAVWYAVEQKKDPQLPQTLVVAMNLAGVWLLNGPTREVLFKFKYTEIYSWEISPEDFVLVTGGPTNQEQEYRLLTDEGHAMGDALQQFVKCIMASQADEGGPSHVHEISAEKDCKEASIEGQ